MIPLSKRASDIGVDDPAPRPCPAPHSGAGPGVVVRMLGRFASRRRSARRDEPLRPWGDGLVEQSVVSLGYGATWATVDRDELVFLWPSLVHLSAGIDAAEAAPVLAQLLAERTRHDTAPPAGPLSPRDAMLAAIRSGLHPAYAAPELAYMHETLMAGAWLGHLVAGRDAWLPAMIAGPVLTLLDAAHSAADAPPDPLADMFADFAAAAVGVRRLTRLARSVDRSGAPRLVRSTAGRGAALFRGA